ncbi:hypothetical protein ACLOJK_018592 [Asimina triloba]
MVQQSSSPNCKIRSPAAMRPYNQIQQPSKQIPTVTAAWPRAEKAVSQHFASNTAKESSYPMCPLETR